MGLLDNLLSRIGYAKVAPLDAPRWALASAERARFAIPDGSLAATQSDLYQRLSWVQVAVAMVAQAAAGVPLRVKARDGETHLDVESHPFEQLLTRPNPLTSRFNFLEATFAWRNLTGNAYWWVNAPSPHAPPSELWLIPPHKLRPVPDGRLYLKGYLYRDGGVEIPLDVHEVVPFPRFNPLNEFVGLSPIAALSRVASADLHQQAWNANFFSENNAKPAGALAFADPVSDPEWERLKAEAKEQHGGTRRNLMMLRGVGAGGIQWLTMGLAQKDMEFLAGRKFNREEIYQTFGVPMGLLSENATEANATIAKATFSEYTLWPQLVSIAQAITLHLLPRFGPDLLAVFDDIRAGDQRLELEQRRVWAGYRTLDELRAADDLPPLGDSRGRLLLVETGRGPLLGGIQEDLAEEGGEPAEVPVPPLKASYGRDLVRWRKKALRLLSEEGNPACAFASDAIPPDLHAAITDNLALATDAASVKAAFAANGKVPSRV